MGGSVAGVVAVDGWEMSGGTVSWWRWLWRVPMIVLVLVVAFVAYANLAASRAGQGILFDEVGEVPEKPVGLVFGTTARIGERENLYFKYRIEAATKLWEEGKVECLLVSGDNREKYYNEPDEMRAALIERGVPKEKIVRDFAGLRTLDTVVRAKEVFGAPSVILVSQRFHNERAAYIARAKGLACVGFNAEDVPASGGVRTRMREVLARVKMWLDVRLLDTQPRHLGEPEYLPIEGHPLRERVAARSPRS